MKQGKNNKEGNQMLRIKYLDCFRFFCTTMLESFIIVKHGGFRNDTAFRRFTAVRWGFTINGNRWRKKMLRRRKNARRLVLFCSNQIFCYWIFFRKWIIFIVTVFMYTYLLVIIFPLYINAFIHLCLKIEFISRKQFY